MQEILGSVYIVCFTLSLITYSPYFLPHQTQFTAEVKNEWGYTSTLSVRLHGLGRDIFTLSNHYFCQYSVRKTFKSKHLNFVIFEISIAMTMTINVYLDMTPCSLVDRYQHLEEHAAPYLSTMNNTKTET
jgi:hypothetical protein